MFQEWFFFVAVTVHKHDTRRSRRCSREGVTVVWTRDVRACTCIHFRMICCVLLLLYKLVYTKFVHVARRTQFKYYYFNIVLGRTVPRWKPVDDRRGRNPYTRKAEPKSSRPFFFFFFNLITSNWSQQSNNGQQILRLREKMFRSITFELKIFL